MSSKLIIVPVEKLQEEINSTVDFFKSIPGIYICLNKTQRSIESILTKEGININKLFFVDCVSSEKVRDDVLCVNPHQLDILNSVINNFVNDIEGEKYIIIDALSTLLIYNEEDKVGNFFKNLTELVSENNTEMIAFSPTTKEELLGKISCHFNESKKA
jgi:archaellum biogenesis ATPase FlaH